MIKQSGTISLLDLQNEFGGSNPIKLGDYYAGGSLVDSGCYRNSTTQQADRDGIAKDAPVPSSGQITLANFYGAAAKIEMLDKMPSNVSYTRTTDGTQETILEFYENSGVGYWRAMNNGVVGASNSFRNGKGSDMQLRITVVSGLTPDLQNITLGAWMDLDATNRQLSFTSGNNTTKSCQLRIETRYKSRLDFIQSKTITFAAINTFVTTEGWATLPMSRTYVRSASGNAEIRYRFYKANVGAANEQQRFQILRNGVLWQDHMIAEMGANNMRLKWYIDSGTLDVNQNPSNANGNIWQEYPSDWQIAVSVGHSQTQSVTMRLILQQGNLHTNERIVSFTMTAQSIFIDDIEWGVLPTEGATFARVVNATGTHSNSFVLRTNGEHIEWRSINANAWLPWVSIGEFAGNLQYKVTTTVGDNRVSDVTTWTDINPPADNSGMLICGPDAVGSESFSSGSYRLEFRQKNKIDNVQVREFIVSCRNNYIDSLAIVQANMPVSQTKEITTLDPVSQYLNYKFWKDSNGDVWQSTWWKGSNISGNKKIIDDVGHHGAQIHIKDISGSATYVGITENTWTDLSSSVMTVQIGLSSNSGYGSVKETKIQVIIRQKDKTSVSLTVTPTMKITNKIPKASINSWITSANCASEIIGYRAPNAPRISGGPWWYHPTLYPGTHSRKLSSETMDNVAVCGLDIYRRGDSRYIRIARLNPPNNASALFANDPNQAQRGFDESFIGVGEIQARITKVSGANPELRGVVLGQWFDISEEQNANDVWTCMGNNHHVGYRRGSTTEGVFRLELRDKHRLNVFVNKNIRILSDFTTAFPWGTSGRSWGGHLLSVSSSVPWYDVRQTAPNDHRLNIMIKNGIWFTKSIGTYPCDQLFFVIKSVTSIVGNYKTIVDGDGNVLEVGRLYPIRHLNGAVTPKVLGIDRVALGNAAPAVCAVHVDVEVLPTSDITTTSDDRKYRYHFYFEKRGGTAVTYTLNQIPNMTVTKDDAGEAQCRLRLFADGTALKYEVRMNNVVKKSGTLSAAGTDTRVYIRLKEHSHTVHNSNSGDSGWSFGRWDYVVPGYDNWFGVNVPETSSGYFDIEVLHHATRQSTNTDKVYRARIDVESTYNPTIELTSPGNFIHEVVGGVHDSSSIYSILPIEAKDNSYYVNGHKIADTLEGVDLEMYATLRSGIIDSYHLTPSMDEWHLWKNGISNLDGYGTLCSYTVIAQPKATDLAVVRISVRQKGRESNSITFDVGIKARSTYIPACVFNNNIPYFTHNKSTTENVSCKVRVMYDSTNRQYLIRYVDDDLNTLYSDYLAKDINNGDLQYKTKFSSGDKELIADQTSWVDMGSGTIVADCKVAGPEQSYKAVWQLDFRQKSRTTNQFSDTVGPGTNNPYVISRPWALVGSKSYSYDGKLTSSGPVYAQVKVVYNGSTTAYLEYKVTNGSGSTHTEKTYLFNSSTWSSKQLPEIKIRRVSNHVDVWSGLSDNVWAPMKSGQYVRIDAEETSSKRMIVEVQCRQGNKTSNTSGIITVNLGAISSYIPSVSFSLSDVSQGPTNIQGPTASMQFQVRIADGNLYWRIMQRANGSTSWTGVRSGQWTGNVGNTTMQVRADPGEPANGNILVASWENVSSNWKAIAETHIPPSIDTARSIRFFLRMRQGNKITNSNSCTVYMSTKRVGY